MQQLPDGECGGDGIAYDAIDVGARVEAYRLHLRGVGLAVGKHRSSTPVSETSSSSVQS